MQELLARLGIQPLNAGAHAGRWLETHGETVASHTPIDGREIARLRLATADDYERVMNVALGAQSRWSLVPGPRRGEVVRQIGEALRAHKKDLGRLVSLEMGKILPEGEGEVQEMIDMADFAVGLSRQLYGLTMPSERPAHRMFEQWHPLGIVGVITAFNFPVAVWAWNALLAAVCGDVTIWKPSHKTPLCAVAVMNLVAEVLEGNGCVGVMSLCAGPTSVGEAMVNDGRVPLISATGSTRMGKRVGEAVARRLGRSLLELGGNNAVVVMDDADLDLATRAILFGAVGTAGQRCTTTRRVIAQRGVAPALTERLLSAYAQVRIGDPLAEGTLMGPLVDPGAVEDMMRALQTARAQGGEVLYGGKRLQGPSYPGHCWVEPTLVRAQPAMDIVQEETFAPVLYLMEAASLDDAIALHNGVPQGLSSAIFTRNLLSAEKFLCAAGSDCGIANVNIGTSGAEIGGAFGGEKETGGGRESGSDCWKQYMRRQTNTINYSSELPLAQGITFG
ncbi:MAG TPA: aldehyde dehydrogenase family protein [Myxococcota bacterium]|jgi:aldehyde dehydrogenase (NAD+)|nr:aldehyde dehydrogenase family protein [Myxococcota bacterium]